jgi:hypothetical protein
MNICRAVSGRQESQDAEIHWWPAPAYLHLRIRAGTATTSTGGVTVFSQTEKNLIISV